MLVLVDLPAGRVLLSVELSLLTLAQVGHCGQFVDASVTRIKLPGSRAGWVAVLGLSGGGGAHKHQTTHGEAKSDFVNVLITGNETPASLFRCEAHHESQPRSGNQLLVTRVTPTRLGANFPQTLTPFHASAEGRLSRSPLASCS
jgi:hypothetical protein